MVDELPFAGWKIASVRMQGRVTIAELESPGGRARLWLETDVLAEDGSPLADIPRWLTSTSIKQLKVKADGTLVLLLDNRTFAVNPLGDRETWSLMMLNEQGELSGRGWVSTPGGHVEEFLSS